MYLFQSEKDCCVKSPSLYDPSSHLGHEASAPNYRATVITEPGQRKKERKS